MKQKFSFKNCISVLLVVAMVLVGLIAVRPVIAAEEDKKADNCTEYASGYYSGEEYKGYRTSVTDEEGNVSYPDYPTKDGYVFAGWYQGTEDGTAIDLEKPLGATAANSKEGAWAKFVPDEVLSVKAQISNNLFTDDADQTKADIRFITSVDNLKYSEIGFDFSINGGNVITRSSNKVYQNLRAVGETEGDTINYKPWGEFCALSTYFKTWTFTNVPEKSFDVQFAVTPFWVTQDGTRVEGATVIKTVRQGLAQSDLRPFEAEYDYEYYETLEDAIEAANDETNGKSEAVITLLDDVVIEDTIAIGGEGLKKCTNITITNFVDVSEDDDKVAYSITKSSDFAGTNMFSVASGYALTIEGADSSSKTGITVDGNSVDTGATLIVNKGTLVVKNATVEDALVNASETATKSVQGGAINSTGASLTVDNCSFKNNASDNNGGAILVSGTTNTISNTTFTGNRSRFNCGGALSCGGGTTTVISCEFDGNWVGTADGTNAANKNGGAVYVNNAKAVLNLTNSTIKNSTAKDGGAIRVTVGNVNIEGCTFANNTATNAGGAICGAFGSSNNTVTINLNSDGTNPNTFRKNSATIGGAIFVQGNDVSTTTDEVTTHTYYACNLNVDGDVFDANWATNGGAIHTGNNAYSIVNIKDTNNTGIFTGNYATANGGAIYKNAGALSIEGYSFERNGIQEVEGASTGVTVLGGAIYNKKSSDADGNELVAQITGCTFGREDNNEYGNATISTTTTGAGGAIYNASGTLEIEETDFYYNDSHGNGGNLGGGAINILNGTVTLVGNTETKNTIKGSTSSAAGAINVADTNSSKLIVSNYVFDSNGGSSTSNGGAIRAANEITLNDCEFYNNVCTNQGGAIYVTNGTKGKLTSDSANNIFDGNEAKYGGAITANGNVCYVDECTFGSDNTASITGNDIHVPYNRTLTISDSTFDNGEVSLLMSGTSVGIANVSGELKDVTFRYDGTYTEGTTISSGITVGSADIATTSDINIIPYTSANGTPVVFGSDLTTNFSAEEQERFSAVEKATGKCFGVDVNGQLVYVNVAQNETTGTGYTTLASAISAATAGDTITLLRDIELGARLENAKNLTIQAPADKSVSIYKGSSFTSNMLKVNGSTSLTITSNGNKTITFDGRSADNAVAGATEGTESAAMLYVLGNLTMKDVTVQYTNCKGTGGALQLNANDDTDTAGKLDLDGCVFNSNISTTSTGGAIHIQALIGSSSLDANVTHEIKNTTFINNSATANCGGAIYMSPYTKANVTGCTFVGNTSSKEGGAVYLNANTNFAVDECSFVNNASIGASAGAIYSKSTGAVSINSTDFVSNIAYGTLSTATTKATGKGGAILVDAAASKGLNITNCDFTGNQASGEGGAIRHNTGDLYVTDCNFTNNAASANFDGYYQANGSGGAIYVSGSANAVIDATAYDTCSFTGNTADRGASNTYTWGAIANNSTGTVKYSGKYVFENNTHQTYGEVGIGVGIHQASTEKSPRVITQINDADSYEALAKAVSIASTTHQTEITLLNSFEITSDRIEILEDQDVIIQNKAGSNVSIYRASAIASNMFHINAGGQLKFASNENGGTLTIDGRTADGTAITKASMLYVRGTLILDGVTVQYGKNTSDNGGAAIRALKGTIDIDNCTFANNQEKNGAAIALYASEGEIICTIDNSTFNANTASASGGALYIGSTNRVTCTINGSTFTGNTATSNGGAIFTENSNEESSLTIEGTTFGSETDETAANNATNGGAIYQALGTTYLFGTVNFIGNSATYGGAVYVAAGTLTTESDDETIASGVVNFTSNTIAAPSKSSTYGGAIYQGGGTISLLGGGKFENNTAGVVTVNLCAAGAVNVAKGTFNVTGYDFTGNTAIKDGGALRVDAGTANVTNCNFTNNSAGTPAELTGSSIFNGRGGAIYISGGGKGVLNLLGSGKFEGNTYTHGTDGFVKNAIYKAAGTMTGTELYTFVDNTVAQ